MTEHPLANKPLSAFQSITAVCDDCGHTTVLDEERLAAMTAVPNFGWLWQHAYCAQCRAAGAGATSVVLHGVLLNKQAGRAPTADAPDRKRSDPYVGLPRRSMFASE